MVTSLASRLLEALGPDTVRSSSKTSPSTRTTRTVSGICPPRPPARATLVEAALAVRIALECGEPGGFRGAGSGLCGGAIPARGGLAPSMVRMNRILELDVRNRCARVQPGLINLHFFAGDRNPWHLLRARPVEPESLDDRWQRRHECRRSALPLVWHDEQPRTGYRVRRCARCDPSHIARRPGLRPYRTLGRFRRHARSRDGGRRPTYTVPGWSVRVGLAAFPDVESASEAVSAIIGAGIVPTALEIMDRLITAAVEAHYHAGFPLDAGAGVLLVEIAGAHDDMRAGEAAIARHPAAARCGPSPPLSRRSGRT